MSRSSKNRTNVKVSWPPFLSGGTTPTVLQQIVSAIYHPLFGKVWLSSEVVDGTAVEASRCVAVGMR